MSQGLSMDDVVNVDIVMSPLAAATRSFGALLVMGSSAVIDTGERLRAYLSLDAVAADFGTTAPEYLAADLYFSQAPQPSSLYVGVFAQTATKGRLLGGKLSAAQQALSNFTGTTTGTLTLPVDGVSDPITALDFSGASNLNGVASIITTAFGGEALRGDTYHVHHGGERLR